MRERCGIRSRRVRSIERARVKWQFTRFRRRASAVSRCFCWRAWWLSRPMACRRPAAVYRGSKATLRIWATQCAHVEEAVGKAVVERVKEAIGGGAARAAVAAPRSPTTAIQASHRRQRHLPPGTRSSVRSSRGRPHVSIANLAGLISPPSPRPPTMPKRSRQLVRAVATSATAPGSVTMTARKTASGGGQMVPRRCIKTLASESPAVGP